MAHTHTLLWSSFQVCGRYLCHLPSSYFFWQGLHFRMMSMVMCFLPFAFTYLLVGADLVERTSVMNQAPAGSCDPTRRGRSDAAGGTPQPHPPHVGRTTLHSARISEETRTADTAIDRRD